MPGNMPRKLVVPVLVDEAPASSAVHPRSWPNGSRVTCKDATGKAVVEMGRVVRDGDGWRVWRLDVDRYHDMGAATSHVEGLGMLPWPTVTEDVTPPSSARPKVKPKSGGKGRTARK